ncbi:hypothetical protein ACFODO_19375 [Acinetobacter sichuanensis]|uniref:Uncharacterized protein n=1 Tax=Acinetobacter sichuanensis TaxID=2136183 RepID=A0A371YIJ1_9GAMM|nr:hypothetical protein [Acinetobacter sichuanensis]RFC81266.1 hypothetical protein C9E89_022790 [Acinetobacter sichuanensis]
MTLKIEPRLGVEVYVNQENTISISNPEQNNEHGEIEDVIVCIHPDYVDAVIDALQKCKAEIFKA